RSQEERARGVAAASILLADVEQFDLPASALDPIRAERDGLLGVLGDPGAPEEVRIGIAEALGRVGDPRLLLEKNRWVEVPAGAFFRGAADKDRDADDDERPAGMVEVSTFRIQRWPVTVGEYARFVEEAKGYATQRWWQD